MASAPSASPDPLADLDAAIAVLAEHEDPAARRIGEAMARWREDQGANSLDRELGLRRRGGVSIRRADANAERDRLLVRLWQSEEAWRDMPPSAAARLMAISASRYETSRWPRERNALAAPSAEPAATWWRTLRISGRTIGAKRLQQILEAEIQ